MNYFRVQSALMVGLQAVPVRIECAQSRRLPYLQILGGGGNASGEQRERVIAALSTLQGGKFRLPARRFTVQIVPGARKLPLESLDLAIAVSILGSVGLIPAAGVENLLICGSLGLDGSLVAFGAPAAPAAFATPAVSGPLLRRLLRETGCASALLPWEGSEALADGQVGRGGGFRSLSELAQFLRGERAAERRKIRSVPGGAAQSAEDRLWARMVGQELGKRAIEISAAGAHHLLLPGPANTRPELLAECLGLLLPPLSAGQAEEVRGIYALAGGPAPDRPFHAFGSRPALPPLLRDTRVRGIEEMLLAHHGVLFVDQACERERAVFPGLLPPMLTGFLPARLQDRRGEIPANAIVVAATPACACGAAGDPCAVCACRPTEARRFHARWRRLLQQYPFDLCLRLVPERGRDAGEPRAAVAARVATARMRMELRQGRPNGRLGEGELLEGLPWGAKARRLWEMLDGRNPGQRNFYLALARVAATLCDLRAGEELVEADLLEALHFFPGGEAAAGPGRAESTSIPEKNSMATP